MVTDTLLSAWFLSWPAIVCMAGLWLRAADRIPPELLWKQFFSWATFLIMATSLILLLLQPRATQVTIPDLFSVAGSLLLVVPPVTACVTWGLRHPYVEGKNWYDDGLHLGWALAGLVGAYLAYAVAAFILLMVFFSAHRGGY